MGGDKKMEKELAKTTLLINKELFLKIKLLASIEDKSVTDILNEALEEYVKSRESEIKEKLSQLMK